MMTIEEHIKFWIKNAESDLESSTKMFENNIFNWSLFVGHLALEKILKAHWIKTNQQLTPPKVHNLLKLAEYSQIDLSEEQMEFLAMVNQFHLETRYQQYKDDFRAIATKEFTQQNLQKSKRCFHG